MKTERMRWGKCLRANKAVGEEGDEKEAEEGHLVRFVHKRLAVLSHKIC